MQKEHEDQMTASNEKVQVLERQLAEASVTAAATAAILDQCRSHQKELQEKLLSLQESKDLAQAEAAKLLDQQAQELGGATTQTGQLKAKLADLQTVVVDLTLERCKLQKAYDRIAKEVKVNAHLRRATDEFNAKVSHIKIEAGGDDLDETPDLILEGSTCSPVTINLELAEEEGVKEASKMEE